MHVAPVPGIVHRTKQVPIEPLAVKRVVLVGLLGQEAYVIVIARNIEQRLFECRGGSQVAIIHLPVAFGVETAVTAQIARVDNERNRYGQLARLLGEQPQRLGVAGVGVGDLDEAKVVRLRMSHETEVLRLAAVGPAPERRRGSMIARHGDPKQRTRIVAIQSVTAARIGGDHATTVADQHARHARFAVVPSAILVGIEIHASFNNGAIADGCVKDQNDQADDGGEK